MWFSKRRKIINLLFVFSLIALLLLIFTIRISSLRRQFFLISDVVHEMQMEVLKAYALIEAGHDGLDSQKSQQVEKAFNNAEMLINAMFYGGVSLHGFYVSPVRDQDILEQLIPLKRLLADLEALSEEYVSTGNSGIQEIGRLKNDFLKRAGIIDDIIEFKQSEREMLYRKISISVLSIWLVLTGFFVLLFLRHEQGERRHRDSLSRQADFLQTLIDTIPAPVFYKDRQGRYLGCNRAFEEFVGIEKDEIRGKTVYDLAPRELAEIYFRKDEELFQNPGYQEYQSSVKDKEGSSRDVIFYKSTFFDDSGEVGGLIGVILDITKRVRAENSLKSLKEELEIKVMERTEALRNEIEYRKMVEEELRREKEQVMLMADQMNTLLGAIPDHILLISEDRRLKWSNHEIYSAAIRNGEGETDRFCYELIHGRKTPCSACPVQTALEKGTIAITEIKNQQGRTFRLRAVPMKSTDGVKDVLVIATDITEIIALQEEALRVRNLSSLGELAAGVAHEINNPVNGIINYAQIILNRLGSHTKEGELARRIIREGDRISSIVYGLLSFARQSETSKTMESLRRILDAPLALLESQFKKDRIKVEIDITDDLPLLYTDRRKMEQVLLDLLINSRYALTRKRSETDKIIRITARRNETHVEVKVWDNGCGIPEDKLNNIWDPFFTTKPVDEGTGLGLSIVHGIISELNGEINVNSVEGEYTEFTIQLPVSEDVQGG